MPEMTFTFKECYDLLKINPKSFLTWLEKAGIDPNAQVDKFDPRKKYLTKEQLLMLAEAHGRILPPLEKDEDVEQEVMTLEALSEQLALTQQHTAQMFDQIAQQLVLAQQHKAEQFDQINATLAQILAILQQGDQTSLQEPQTTSANSAEPQETAPKVSTTKPQARSKTSAKKKRARGKKLPSGLVLVRDFASQHSMTTERVSAAAKAGKLVLVRGKWLVNSRWANEALDAQGRHDFYIVFHERNGLTPCEQCPHEIENHRDEKMALSIQTV